MALTGRHDYAYEPRIHRLSESFIAAMTCGTVGGIASAALPAPWWYAVATATTVVGLWSIRRAWRLGLWIRDGRVLVQNYWRTFDFPLADVTALGLAMIDEGGSLIPAWAFRLGNGKLVRAQATPAKPSEQEFAWRRLSSLVPAEAERVTPDFSARPWWQRIWRR